MISYEGLENKLAEKGLTRSDLTKKLGISSRTVAKISKGEKLSRIVLVKISDFLGCEPTELYHEERIITTYSDYGHDDRNTMKKIVIFGGGTGISNILSGLKLFPVDVTAIIAVSDDGRLLVRLQPTQVSPVNLDEGGKQRPGIYGGHGQPCLLELGWEVWSGPLETNSILPLPGHLSELHPVNEVNTKGQ